jgi:DNA-binding NarL/FixJ family response regulator
MKRVLIVADHSLVAHTIRLALRQTAGFEVAGFIDGRHTARRHLKELQPDVVIVDDMQSAVLALERLREVSEDAPDSTNLLLTFRMGDDWLDQAFTAGATAVISKNMQRLALGTVLRETIQNNVVHRPRARAGAAAQETRCPLTARELEILSLAAQGMTNGRIGRELWVTEQTVKFHLSNTYRKLGVTNRTEASRYAHVHDLVTPHAQIAS